MPELAAGQPAADPSWAELLERFERHLDALEEALDRDGDVGDVAGWRPEAGPDQTLHPDEALRAVELLSRARAIHARMDGARGIVQVELAELGRRRVAGAAYAVNTR